MIDLRVLELSQSVAGAYTGRLLATAGADVTLVEPLEGLSVAAHATAVAGASVGSQRRV